MVKCQNCGWRGELKECNWDYDFDAVTLPGEAEGRPHCPKCDGTDLIDLNQDMVLV